MGVLNLALGRSAVLPFPAKLSRLVAYRLGEEGLARMKVKAVAVSCFDAFERVGSDVVVSLQPSCKVA